MADGKWIPELTADTPLSEAARQALKVRLHVVRDHLPLAVEEGERAQDGEEAAAAATPSRRRGPRLGRVPVRRPGASERSSGGPAGRTFLSFRLRRGSTGGGASAPCGDGAKGRPAIRGVHRGDA